MKHLLLILAIFCVAGTSAQNDQAMERSKKMYEEIVAKPLYVVLDVEDEDHVEKLTKKGRTAELESYKKIISRSNAYLKLAVAAHLTQLKDVHYITQAEYKKYSNSEKKPINVLMRRFPWDLGVSRNAKFNSVSGQSSSGMAWSETKLESLDMDTNNVKDVSVIEFMTYMDGEMMAIYTQHLNKMLYSYGELCYTLRNYNQTITGALKKENRDEMVARSLVVVGNLKTKTLLIKKSSIADGLNEDVIKGVYANAFKLVSDAEFDTELANKSDKVVLVFPMSFPAGQTNMMPAMHTMFEPSSGNVHWPNPKKCSGTIEKKHFEYYVKTGK